MTGLGFESQLAQAPPACPRAVEEIAPGVLLRISVLAPMTAHGADHASVLPRVRKTRALLAILAMASPKPVPRSVLAQLLWSRRASEQARGSLRQALRELHLALGPAAGKLLRIERTSVALSNAGLELDARVMALAGPVHPERLALWQGTFVPDLIGLDPAFDKWVNERLTELRQWALTAAEAILAEVVDADEALGVAEGLLRIDATHEAAWRAVIRAHAERGDRAAALNAYEACQTALFEHARIAPSPETTALAKRLRATMKAPAEIPERDDSRRPRRASAATRMRLAVAALRGRADDCTAELGAALGDELAAALARCRWLGCLACHDQQEPDAEFLLDGAVRRHGDRVRVLVRLLDLRAQRQVVWSDRYDDDLSDIFAMQDRIAGMTVARLEPQLWLRESARVARDGYIPQTAQDLVSAAVPAMFRLDFGAFHAAGKLLTHAVAEDPGNASAHSWAAQWHILALGQGWAPESATSIDGARELSARAMHLDPDDARALTLAGHVRGFIDGRPDEALALHERALLINPHLPLSWCFSGLAYAYNGDFDEAIRRVNHAMALSPGDPMTYFYQMSLCLPLLLRGERELALAAGRRAIALNPGLSSSHKAFLATVGHLGRTDEARYSRSTLLELEPGFTVEEAVRRSPLRSPAARTIYADGLRAAGLP
jgi:DNA-binding SARP family transcriptional activator